MRVRGEVPSGAGSLGQGREAARHLLPSQRRSGPRARPRMSDRAAGLLGELFWENRGPQADLVSAQPSCTSRGDPLQPLSAPLCSQQQPGPGAEEQGQDAASWSPRVHGRFGPACGGCRSWSARPGLGPPLLGQARGDARPLTCRCHWCSGVVAGTDPCQASGGLPGRGQLGLPGLGRKGPPDRFCFSQLRVDNRHLCLNSTPDENRK